MVSHGVQKSHSEQFAQFTARSKAGESDDGGCCKVDGASTEAAWTGESTGASSYFWLGAPCLAAFLQVRSHQTAAFTRRSSDVAVEDGVLH